MKTELSCDVQKDLSDALATVEEALHQPNMDDGDLRRKQLTMPPLPLLVPDLSLRVLPFLQGVPSNLLRGVGFGAMVTKMEPSQWLSHAPPVIQLLPLPKLVLKPRQRQKL